MMNIPLTKQWITRWEGTKYNAYDDKTGKTIVPNVPILGNPTIGVGFNLRVLNARDLLTQVGADYDSIISGRASLTPDQVDQILLADINIALTSVKSMFPEFDSYPEDKQLVLIDIVFNMGLKTFSSFYNTVALIRMQSWLPASMNLQKSAWFHQVGTAINQRGGADCAVLGGEKTPEEILLK
jgi:lysozyme